MKNSNFIHVATSTPSCFKKMWAGNIFLPYLQRGVKRVLLPLLQCTEKDWSISKCKELPS